MTGPLVVLLVVGVSFVTGYMVATCWTWLSPAWREQRRSHAAAVKHLLNTLNQVEMTRRDAR